jgi:hypothetical protein
MVKLYCSLCKKKKEATPLDMEDVFFGNYVKFMRAIGFSKHTEKLGICKKDMSDYKKMRLAHQNKIVFYGLLAVIFGILYLYFSNSILFSVLVALFVFGLSLFSYCPPLKKN